MSELILHHYEASPFAEKARRIMGLKGLSWRSVEVPMVMPKPDLMPLTGGYRKIPVLQIGADIYCDTHLIARELEQRFPDQTLFPMGDRGIAYGIGAWSDHAFFDDILTIVMSSAENWEARMREDRKQLFSEADWAGAKAKLAHARTQVRAHGALIEAQLSDGRRFLYGDAPGFVDLQASHMFWFCWRNFPDADEMFAGFERVRAWEERIAALGHGNVSPIESGAAVEAARLAESTTQPWVDPDDPQALPLGAIVDVAPDDYGKEPAQGELLVYGPDRIAIRVEGERTGNIVIHFPRLGFRVDLSESQRS